MTGYLYAGPALALVVGLALLGSVALPLGRHLARFREEHGRDATDVELDRLLRPQVTAAQLTRVRVGFALVPLSLLWAALIPAVVAR